MAIFYLDTSALVKRYRSEPGTEVVEELLSEPSPDDRFFVSFLSVLELTSAILRLVRGGQAREDTANEVLASFRRDLHDLLEVWPLNEGIAIAAVSAVERHRLRSADALHLATAQTIAALAPGARVVMVSSDRELLDAAEAAGLTPLDPQARGSGESLRQIRQR